MVILGIHDGHNASASLIVDGELVCALGEERLSRDKHQYGFSSRAINAVLDSANIKINDVQSHRNVNCNTASSIFLYIKKFYINN